MSPLRRPVSALVVIWLATTAATGAQRLSGNDPQSLYRPPEPSVLRSFKMQQMLQDERPPNGSRAAVRDRV